MFSNIEAAIDWLKNPPETTAQLRRRIEKQSEKIAELISQREILTRIARRKDPQDMSLRELFDHVAIVNDAIRAALASHPDIEPRESL